jgi:hypothetical protein
VYDAFTQIEVKGRPLFFVSMASAFQLQQMFVERQLFIWSEGGVSDIFELASR